MPDAAPPDTGQGEEVHPPDLRLADGSRSGNVGASCDPKSGAGCTGAATCLHVLDETAVCTIKGCTLEDVSTAQREDTCPAVPSPGSPGQTVATVCTRVPTTGTNHCLPACTPSPTSNPCLAFGSKLACDPVSITYNDHSEVCLFPICQNDMDCGIPSMKPSSTCHRVSQTCITNGQPSVLVGAACTTSSQCGPGQFCYPQRKDAQGKVLVEGGYCTVVGCSYGGPWTCPSGSKCFRIGSGNTMSLCLATGCKASSPDDSDGCRDEATKGQYDCIFIDKTEVCWLASR